MTRTASPLLDPVTIGDLQLPNRIVMASMTRARTHNARFVPTDLQAKYYRQRASAGMIMTEGTWPSRQAVGANSVPGLFTKAQADGWKRVTDAVHTAGGRIVAQLGHSGGASHPDLLDGDPPIAPSAVNLDHQVFAGERRPTPIPRAMTRSDIQRTIDDYAAATRWARLAGFDGVELHGIVGFLIPEFLSDTFNHREDDYGGSAENRARFPLEVLAAMISQWRPGRVGVKLSPSVGMGALQPTAATLPTYEHLITKAGALGLAWVQLYETGHDLTNTPLREAAGGVAAYFRTRFHGAIIANGGLDAASAATLLLDGIADAAAFGAPYLANPDLVGRIRHGLPWASTPNHELWYGGGEIGYTDFPAAQP